VTTSANAGDALTLPIATVSDRRVVINAGANTLSIFPGVSSQNINALSNGAAYSLPAGGVVEFICAQYGTWDTILSEGVGLSYYSPSNPLYIAHRGGSQIGPENTMEAFAANFALGNRALEFDLRQLSDAALGVIHDATVDAVTTSTGNVVGFDTAGFTALSIDALTWHGTNTDTLRPPMLGDVVGEYAQRAYLFPEVKTLGSAQVVIDALSAAQVPTSQAVIQSGSLIDLDEVVLSGYGAMYLPTGTSQIADVLTAGVQWVALADTESDSVFQDWHAAGVKVAAYTIYRRWRLEQLKALNAISAFICGDPAYLARATPFRTTDNFAAQTWQPGMIASVADTVVTATVRGRFFSSSKFGWNDTLGGYTMLGYLSPVKGDSNCRDFTVEFTVSYVSSSTNDRWAAIFLAPTDHAYHDASAPTENGYNVLVRKDGRVHVYERVNGVVNQLVVSSTSLISDGTDVKYRITVTSSSITISRLNGDGSVNYEVTANDTTHGCGYLHLGRNGLNCRISALSIS
jgi:glycerophosphoryl diester phosphodiesterase